MSENCISYDLTGWRGDDGWIVRQHDAIRKFKYRGDMQTSGCEVVGALREGGQGRVGVVVLSTNQRDETTAMCGVTNSLPSRADDPVTLAPVLVALQRRIADRWALHGSSAAWQALNSRRQGG